MEQIRRVFDDNLGIITKYPSCLFHCFKLLFFSESFINVPAQYWPDKNDIADGFSMSAWIQPQENTNGYILSKSNPDGSRVFYSLKIITTNVGTQLIVGYSATGSNVS